MATKCIEFDAFYILGKMTQIKQITVANTSVSVILNKEADDYISLTDLARLRDADRSNYIIQNWMRSRHTIEFLGLWEQLNNPNFKCIEFDAFRQQSGLNSFTLTPKQWIESTDAIGMTSKRGRGGGTYAHKDIAFEFCSWLSPVFKLYLIKEYQRLVAVERSQLALAWDVKRLLSKTNYTIHTDAIKNIIIPKIRKEELKQGLVYATEADILNLALFGCTAKQWQDANPEIGAKQNMRDYASINQLIVLSNLESYNAELIKLGLSSQERLFKLHKMAKEQLKVLSQTNAEQNFRRLTSDNDNAQLLLE